MRLIDADERKQQIESPYTEYPIMIQIRKALKDFIDDAPTIDPVRHGKWISVPHKKARICSVCECDEPYKFADENADVFDYCPRCGAKMDAKEVWTYFD